MSQIFTGQWKSDGAIVYIPIGANFHKVTIWKKSPTNLGLFKIEKTAQMAAGEEVWFNRVDNVGTADTTETIVYNTTGGYITAYNTNSITTGTTVSVGGFKGFSFSATPQTDEDIWYYEVLVADRDVNHGDINA